MFFDFFFNSGIFVELIVINIYFLVCGKRVYLGKIKNICVVFMLCNGSIFLYKNFSDVCNY